jgi:hypothetical protein
MFHSLTGLFRCDVSLRPFVFADLWITADLYRQRNTAFLKIPGMLQLQFVIIGMGKSSRVPSGLVREWSLCPASTPVLLLTSLII